jgi:hypothetical protein
MLRSWGGRQLRSHGFVAANFRHGLNRRHLSDARQFSKDTPCRALVPLALELAEGVFGQMGGTEGLVGARQSPQCLAAFQHERLNPKKPIHTTRQSWCLGNVWALSVNVPALTQDVRNGVRATALAQSGLHLIGLDLPGCSWPKLPHDGLDRKFKFFN